MQLGEFIDTMEIFNGYLNFMGSLENSAAVFDKGPKESHKKEVKYFLDKGYDKTSLFLSLGLTLTNNEIEYIIKVIKYLGNREILLKVNTKKVTN